MVRGQCVNTRSVENKEFELYRLFSRKNELPNEFDNDNEPRKDSCKGSTFRGMKISHVMQ